MSNTDRKTEISFVAMKEEHLAQVLELAEESNLSFWSYQEYRAELNREDSVCVVAQDSNVRVAGFLIARLIKEELYCEFNNIAVGKKFRLLGIGRELVNILTKASLNNGLVKILLELRSSNGIAFEFYSSLGFKLLGKRKDFYTNPPEDGLTMVKDLGESAA